MQAILLSWLQSWRFSWKAFSSLQITVILLSTPLAESIQCLAPGLTFRCCIESTTQSPQWQLTVPHEVAAARDV